MAAVSLTPSRYEGSLREYSLRSSFGIVLQLSLRELATVRLLTPCCGSELLASEVCSSCSQALGPRPLFRQAEVVGQWAGALEAWLLAFGLWQPLEAILQTRELEASLEELTLVLREESERAVAQELAFLKAVSRKKWPLASEAEQARTDAWFESFVNE